jgi:hypothetical protein
VTEKPGRARICYDHTKTTSKGVALSVPHRNSVSARIWRFRAIRPTGVDRRKIIPIPSGTEISELFAHFRRIVEEISGDLKGSDARVSALSARVD